MKNKIIKTMLAGIFALAFAASASAAERKTTIKVYGMTCQKCANGVADSLKQLKGVKNVEVSVKKAEAVVTYDDQLMTVAQIKKQIEKSGFSTKPKGK